MPSPRLSSSTTTSAGWVSLVSNPSQVDSLATMSMSSRFEAMKAMIPSSTNLWSSTSATRVGDVRVRPALSPTWHPSPIAARDPRVRLDVNVGLVSA